MLRAITLVAVLAVSIPLAVGSASAQPEEPYIETVVRWPPGQETEATRQLDASGRAAQATDVGFRVVGDVVCGERAEYSLEVVLDNEDMPPWAGASLEPEDARRVQFDLPQGSHSDTPYRYQDGPDLGIVWDLEEAPNDAAYTYHVVVSHARLVPETTDCTPPLSTRAQLHHTANLTAVAPETPPGDGTDETDGAGDGSTPGPPVLAVIAVLLLAVGAARRRRQLHGIVLKLGSLN